MLNDKLEVKALYDPGSRITLINSKLVQVTNIKPNYCYDTIKTISGGDLLKKSPSARIMFTSSGLSFLAQFSESRFNNDETNDLEYNSSKFCIIAAADIFAEKFKKYNITSNSFHPGLVRTDMSRRVMDRQMSWPQFILGLFVFALTMVVGKTAEEGAQTAIHLACANEVDGVTGKFFAETVPTFKPGLAHDQSLCNAIWLHSERVVGLKEEEKLF
ncbi:retinol dehydrogenase 14-like [Diabrotica virgifera virgifera]|uniref:Retinol dehydrogenase 14 n=1 Tax=Diabrotica virgifera virgifera TaxID=50390 RepID=A0ABM5L0L1_DIAVI|nr:retinol dehydrogenase 14-like [Diabrotica virgifera virgifera]